MALHLLLLARWYRKILSNGFLYVAKILLFVSFKEMNERKYPFQLPAKTMLLSNVKATQVKIAFSAKPFAVSINKIMMHLLSSRVIHWKMKLMLFSTSCRRVTLNSSFIYRFCAAVSPPFTFVRPCCLQNGRIVIAYIYLYNLWSKLWHVAHEQTCSSNAKSVEKKNDRWRFVLIIIIYLFKFDTPPFSALVSKPKFST